MPPGVLATLGRMFWWSRWGQARSPGAGKPSEDAGHDGPSKPARLVSNGLSATGLEAKRRLFCSHQETFPEIQRDIRYGQVNCFMLDQLTHIDHSLATRSCLSQDAVG